VCGFGGCVVEDVRADFSRCRGEKSLSFHLRETSVRSGDSELDSPEVV